MPYLIVRTDVRPPESNRRTLRDYHDSQEIRRASAMAETYDAAMRMARAFSACGQVRNGRQRVRVIPIRGVKPGANSRPRG